MTSIEIIALGVVASIIAHFILRALDQS